MDWLFFLSSRCLPGTHKPVPFRKWYGNLGERREIFSNVQCIMCTGTASKPTKRKIFDVMSVSPEETLIIKMTPDRKNLQYAVQYVEDSIPMTDLFSTILYEVKNNKEKTKRTIVYSFARCKTNVPYYGGCSSCI